MAAVDENAVSRAVRGLPIRRNKAALIVTSLLKAQDVAGMEAFLPCCERQGAELLGELGARRGATTTHIRTTAPDVPW
jgi:hypothetical protein